MSGDVTREAADPERRGATRLGFWAAVVVAGAAATALALGVTTPARSGPFCSGSCITYPYTDAAAFVPRDYFWMYPPALMSLSFVVLLVCVHSRAPAEKRVFSQVGLSFAVISATAIVCDYSIQLAVMQPALSKAKPETASCSRCTTPTESSLPWKTWDTCSLASPSSSPHSQ